MYKGFLSILLFVFSFCCFSQNKLKIIDSLKLVIAKNPSDSIRINAYSDICWYYRNISIDSAFAYGDLALQLSKKINNKLGEAQAYNDIGILHYDLAEYRKSMDYYKKSLVIRSKLRDTMGIAALYNKIGLVHQNTFKMDSAIFFATKALKIYEIKNHTRYVTFVKNNIANIYKGLKQYKKALNTHLEIAQENERNKDYLQLTRSYNNIANAYLFLKDTVRSIEYYKKSITLAEKFDYKRELAALYNNYGSVLLGKKQYKEAIDLTSQSLKLRKELEDNYGIASTSLHLAGLHLNKRDFNKAKNHLYFGAKLSKNIDANELKIDAYDKLSSYHAFKNNPDSVIYYKELFKTLKDTIYSNQVIKEVAEVQEKYDTAERERQILSQRADIAENELNLNKKNTQLIGLVLAIVLLCILTYLIYNQQRLKNLQLKKESELKQALIRIETQNRLQKQRLQISRDLHDNIGAQLTFIISSIESLQYGFKITNNKITSKLYHISAFTKETIYELRDTIWAMNKSDITLDDLQSRISNFVKKANIHSNGIDFKFIVDTNISKEIKFTSVKGMNIYRIVQEAINNSIKYSEAELISVEISNNNNLEIDINDDGKGFDENKTQYGNGLNNMKKRAQEIGADLNLKSKVGIGTSIKLKIIT
ncbi:tetratricopeptide repeat-containing sensor histidine kinase [uncultured Algibacter sp.]|uniref:tetratricopeptide repeat-containing sensor histidine kinase n=1 Tax=uncultured Algibacter sp. TaxID=298659 RepID=UPI00262D04A8|nr:tetratricopeptide repeat-containing sensor histidine kinase [uncultured Algibacter sp.]